MLAAGAIVLVGAYFAARKTDIRIVLGVSATALFALAGQFEQVFVFVAKEMANERTVVPICTAMGFAYVVKLTACDTHLVRMLTAPLRWVRALLIPGGTCVGWLVNMAIVSQSSTAATVGPVLVPLVLAARVSLPTAGAMLLLGASMGGELCNPGAVEIVTLAQLLGLSNEATVLRVMPANLVASITALAVFWWLSVRAERRAREAAIDTEPAADAPPIAGTLEVPADEFHINPLKALVPLLPLAILFVVPSLFTLPEALTTSIMIAAAMLSGVVAAGLTDLSKAGKLASAFFEGAGYAYANVISLIVTATLFTEAIKANGIIEALAAMLSHQPMIAACSAVLLPGGLAAVSGSGIAPAVAVMKVLVPLAPSMGLDPGLVGAHCAVAAQLGRTMSPAAAVVMMTSVVSGVPAVELLKRVTIPLVAGAAATLVAGLLGLV
jgi:DcuC family C4-dicarboxylate transporter